MILCAECENPVIKMPAKPTGLIFCSTECRHNSRKVGGKMWQKSRDTQLERYGGSYSNSKEKKAQVSATMTKFDEEARKKCLELSAEGNSGRAIGKILGMGQTTVRRILDQAKLEAEEPKEESSEVGMDLEKFIAQAKFIHQETYDYSESAYQMGSKIKIICKIHGVFEQWPPAHLKGRGCPNCGMVKRAKTQSKGTEQFIKEAREIHGMDYDYSESLYSNAFNKVRIRCLTHHEVFEQAPHDHLKGQGCPKCGRKSSEELRSLGKEEFIKLSKEIHGDKYDYSKVVYLGNKDNVEIVCLIDDHGSFWQSPNGHMSHEQGCPKCWDLRRVEINQTPEARAKMSETVKQVWKEMSSERKEEIREAQVLGMVEKHGVLNPVDIPGVLEKIHEAKKANGSYGKSKVEDLFYDYLISVFGIDNVKRQSRINEWSVDFCISPHEIYIQVDGKYYHGLDRPIEEIGLSENEVDKNIYATYHRDLRQNAWFKERNMNLLRIDDSQVYRFLKQEIKCEAILELEKYSPSKSEKVPDTECLPLADELTNKLN